MAEWSFLTNHARVLVCIAHDPGVRLRDIATTLGITERSAYSIVTDLTEGGYVVKNKDGRRNRYQIQSHLPLREAITQERTIGEVLDVLVESKIPRRATTSARVTGRVARSSHPPSRPSGATPPGTLQKLTVSAAARYLPDQIEGSPKRASGDHFARPIRFRSVTAPAIGHEPAHDSQHTCGPRLPR